VRMCVSGVFIFMCLCMCLCVCLGRVCCPKCNALLVCRVWFMRCVHDIAPPGCACVCRLCAVYMTLYRQAVREERICNHLLQPNKLYDPLENDVCQKMLKVPPPTHTHTHTSTHHHPSSFCGPPPPPQLR
jgi:hypothetical protein